MSSCSSLITKEDCQKDMYNLGLDHGKHGGANLVENIRRVCRNDLKLEAYTIGFKIGWSDFCTPFHGFEMGKKADNYRSFCPAEKEILFREKYLIGKIVFEKIDQQHDIEDKIKELSGQLEKDKSDIAIQDELKINKENLNSLKREIQFFELRGKSLVHTN
jgi:hypothetical protein